MAGEVTDAEPAAEVAPAAPTPPAERDAALDTLRGVAVLGILLMNILLFGLPSGADSNPTAAGGADEPNLLFWFASQVLFEGKMRCIFSMLFGAGAVLLTARAGPEAADIAARRNLWLVLFGLLHAYLLWHGDILFWYGLAGLALYPFRRVRAGWLIVLGVLLTAGEIPRSLWNHHEMRRAEADAAAARTAEVLAAEFDGPPLTPEQDEAIRAWDGRRDGMQPNRALIDKELAARRGTYVQSFVWRAKRVAEDQAYGVYRYALTDVVGMMLIGMGLFKLGVFTAARSAWFYWGLLAVGYGVGVPLNAAVGLEEIAAGFDPARYTALAGASYNPGRLLVALGHVAVVMLVCKAGLLGFLTRRLAAVGRMPLTNYLFETVACCAVFEGWGYGRFGHLQRYELLGVVAGVWAAQLLLSPLWLRVFRYGPAEWLWRALAYWHCPPVRADRPPDAQAASDAPATALTSSPPPSA